MNKQELIKNIEKISYSDLHYNSPESMLIEQKHMILDRIEQLDEPQQPVVPTCAKPWLEQAQCSTDVIDLFSEVEYATDSDGFISKHWRWSPEFYDWLCDDADTLYLLCDALRYGYEVEKEPLYRVKLGEGYFAKYLGIGALIIPDDTREFKIFNSKSDAERTASTIGGTVEEVTEG